MMVVCWGVLVGMGCGCGKGGLVCRCSGGLLFTILRAVVRIRHSQLPPETRPPWCQSGTSFQTKTIDSKKGKHVQIGHSTFARYIFYNTLVHLNYA